MARGDLRCIEGRLFRHDPQYDDPYLETDVGECPDCSGAGCGDDGEPGEDGWQDISTAPKDGTRILVWFPDVGFQHVCVWLPVAAVWACTYTNGTLTYFDASRPTHWRHLPSPPKGETT